MRVLARAPSAARLPPVRSASLALGYALGPPCAHTVPTPTRAVGITYQHGNFIERNLYFILYFMSQVTPGPPPVISCHAI